MNVAVCRYSRDDANLETLSVAVLYNENIILLYLNYISKLQIIFYY